MSTITKEFTKEQLIEFATAILDVEKAMASNDLSGRESRASAAIAEIALASLEAEPVLECFKRLLHHAYGMTMGHDWNKGTMAGHHRDKLCRAVEECRAAMLQGANGTLTNEGAIPVTQFKPVADLYGLTSPTGGETSFTFDAVEARDFIDGGWSCQEYVELGRYQEALTDHSEGDLDMVRPVMFICGNLLPGDAEKLKAAIEEFNHSGEPTIMIAGDSPVIPDGWVMVPIEPTIAILDEFDSIIDYGAEDSKDAWSRLLAAAWIKSLPAAPQLEVK